MSTLQTKAVACARPVRWRSVAATSGATVVLLALAYGRTDDPGGAVAVLRGVAALLAVGVAFAVDDAAAEVLAPSPSSLLARRLLAVLPVLVVTGTVWAAAVALVAARGGEPPAVGLTVEALAIWLLVLLVAATLARRGRVEPGAVVAPVGPLVLLLALQLPSGWNVLGSAPASWDAAHVRIAVVAAISALACLLLFRDPAATRPRQGH